MQTPFCASSRVSSHRLSSTSPTPPSGSNTDWRCTSCSKLLGVFRGIRMHLRFTRGHEYLAGFPVQATCRGCGTLNEATAPRR